MLMTGTPSLHSTTIWNSELAESAAENRQLQVFNNVCNNINISSSGGYATSYSTSNGRSQDLRRRVWVTKPQLRRSSRATTNQETGGGQRRQAPELQLHHSTSGSICDTSPIKINPRQLDFTHESLRAVGPEAGWSNRELDHIERLWLQLFSTTSDWWDNRPLKAIQQNWRALQERPECPDFKHKITKEALWEESKWNPRWVKVKLANVLGCQHHAEKRIFIEKTWQKFFSDPSQWWDHRFDKTNVRHPDFKHKATQESLWIDSRLTPKWVKAELAALHPGALQRSVFSWNMKLENFVKKKQYLQAFSFYLKMQSEGIQPDKLTFVRVLNACAGAANLSEGRRVHAQVMQSKYQEEVIVGNCLINMYGKCGSVEDACQVFDSMRMHDTVSWSVLIQACMRCGDGEKGFILFQQMQRENFEADVITFLSILNTCTSIGELEEGRYIHSQLVVKGHAADVFLMSCLLDMYGKSGSIEDACRVFNDMSVQNEVAWTSMIGGYLKCGQSQKAIDLFRMMQQEEMESDSVTFVVALKACASLAAIEEGRQVHAEVIQRGWEPEIMVSNSLIDMYLKCGCIEDACELFNRMPVRTVVSWNAMIGGYAKCGCSSKVLSLFRQMQLERVHPDSVTFVAVLNVCSCMMLIEEGRLVHEQIMQTDYRNNAVVCNSLINMYCKNWSMEEACRVFNSMLVHDAVCWSALIGGYLKSGEGMKALDAFRKMELEGVEPDIVTFVVVLNACACIAALEEGRKVHVKIIQRGYESNLMVGNSLIDMYVKCDSIEEAFAVLNSMQERDTVSWNAMIVGCVKCDQAEKALELFQEMLENKVEPDSVTFVGIITACSSLAALDKGRNVHWQAVACGCDSDVFVANCLIDMYSKCGSIEEACLLFNSMPVRDAVSWNTMIMAYAIHGLGKEAIKLFRHKDVIIDKGTFVCLLSALSRTGLVDEGEYFFESISAIYSVPIAVEHCSCMVDLRGRAGRVDEAEDIISKMPYKPTLPVLTALLASCQVYDNFEIGERAAKQLLRLHPDNTSAYVLLSNIHGGAAG